MTLATIDSDAAFAVHEIAQDRTRPETFEREDEPPRSTLLRLQVDDGRGEYALPWPYILRSNIEGEDDFFAFKSGFPLHSSIAVRGWKLWTD